MKLMVWSNRFEIDACHIEHNAGFEVSGFAFRSEPEPNQRPLQPWDLRKLQCLTVTVTRRDWYSNGKLPVKLGWMKKVIFA